jgi:shikimate dehydrogenase
LDISLKQVKSSLEMMRALNVRGANVTVPYKGNVLAYLDVVDPEAKWLGSVNTLYRKGEKLCGTSTDGEGFLRSLGSWRKKLKGSRGLLLGAGGAAKAVAGALARSGVTGFYISNRSSQKAVALVKALRGRYPRLDVMGIASTDAQKLLPYCDWVIQATSLGLKGEPSPIFLSNAKRGAWAVDLIYHRETDFLRQARRHGLPHLNGAGMLLHQGALSFERWTGRKAPLEVMRKALQNGLSKR